ncbi:MAG: DUF937 domain-containing protein [Oscillospiraceae bacterium]|nr:DUF937 domain-containing protein [Oscillospiraceae bacterium]
MDMNSILSTMLSSDSIRTISQSTGASQKEVKTVLASALPSLLNGAADQANNSQTADGFAGALADHAQSDTRDLGSFLSNVDLTDGGKIISHLLGTNTSAATQQAADASGLDPAKVAKILAIAAPLLMNLLGQQSSQSANSGNSIGSLMSTLVGGSDMGSLLSGLLGGSTGSTTQTTGTGKKKKKKKTSSSAKKEEGGLLDALLGLLK